MFVTKLAALIRWRNSCHEDIVFPGEWNRLSCDIGWNFQLINISCTRCPISVIVDCVHFTQTILALQYTHNGNNTKQLQTTYRNGEVQKLSDNSVVVDTKGRTTVGNYVYVVNYFYNLHNHIFTEHRAARSRPL